MLFHNELWQEKLKALAIRTYLWKEQGGQLVMSHNDECDKQAAGWVPVCFLFVCGSSELWAI